MRNATLPDGGETMVWPEVADDSFSGCGFAGIGGGVAVGGVNF